MFFFQSRPGADPDFLKRGGKQRDPNPNFPSFLKVFRQNGDLPPPVDCAPCPVLYIIRYSTSQFYRKYYFGQEEEEMKLCLMILPVPWYQSEIPLLFNGIYKVAVIFLTFITGSSSRLLRIRFSADLTMYWFPVCHFRCKEFNPLVIWIWNQNIAISTIVGTSPHIMPFMAYKDKIRYFYLPIIGPRGACIFAYIII